MLPRWQECQWRGFLLPRRKTMCIEKRKDDDGVRLFVTGDQSEDKEQVYCIDKS